MQPGTAKTLDAIINAALRGELDETHARRLHELGPEAVAPAIPSLRSRTRLAAGKHIGEQDARLSEQDTVIATPLLRSRTSLQRQRETQQSNRSDRGAATQAVLMSVHRTLRLRGLNPTKTTADALKTYLTTGQLPPLPNTDIASG